MDLREYRLRLVERELASVKKQLADLQTLRDNWGGMTKLGKFIFRVAVALCGIGGLNVIYRIIVWLAKPLPRNGW